MKTKKLTAYTLVIAMIVLLLPAAVFGDDTYSSVTVGPLTVSVSSGTEALEITGTSPSFTISSTDSDYPYSFSLLLTHGAYNGTPTVSNGGQFTVYSKSDSVDYCLVTLPENTASAVTISVADGASTTITFACEIPNGGQAGAAGTGIFSYIPAPGQFINEGIRSGGWGDIYQNGGTALKQLVNNFSGTGISLGGFGGSVFFDFGTDGISDNAVNSYGVDFIVYGNAFSNWSEPGCIQVAPDADHNGVPDKWYDIAGSRYYMSGTQKTYGQIYANPIPGDNTPPQASTLAAVSYADLSDVDINGNNQTWSEFSTMTTNSWHNHSWFPLARNYFDAPTREAATYVGGSKAMANLDKLVPANGTTPIEVKENQNIIKYDNSILVSDTATLSYRGVNLNTISNATGDYTYGYCDVHPNGSNYGTAVNPYSAAANTSGGDGIDIAWAVNDDGTPAGLSNIRFVRIYTGIMKVDGTFGETSTEVCGIYTVTGGGSGTAASDLTVETGQNMRTHENYSAQTVITSEDSYTLNIFSDEDNVFVNGENVSASCSSDVSYDKTVTFEGGDTQYVQIITQSGTESPYITLFRIVKNS